MDPDSPTQKLIERTRQRREMLNQRMAFMPEAAPRKRRTPVFEEDGQESVLSEQTSNQEDSPKRQCLRGTEKEIKPDTPAIRGVQSRAKDLAESLHAKDDQENRDGEAPVPTPRKSLTSPPLGRKNIPRNEKTSTPSTHGNALPSTRKGRFAALAQSINDWEDDLTHHSIHKDQGTKAASQSSVKKDEGKNIPKSRSGAALSPMKTALNSPKKNQAPPPPCSPNNAFSRASSLRGSKVTINRSPKPFVPSYTTGSPTIRSVKPMGSSSDIAMEMDQGANHAPVISKSATSIISTIPTDIPVNAPGLNETPPPVNCKITAVENPPLKSIPDRLITSAKKSQTPKGRLSIEPSRQPLSAKVERFEQKISENTPKFGLSSSTRETRTQKQVCTPALSASTPVTSSIGAVASKPTKDCDPSELPISQRMSQMQEKLEKTTPNRKTQDEPTEYPVGARMSAWENMSSSNMVSDIKKVNAADATTVIKRTPAGKAASSLQASGSIPKPPPAPVPKVTPSVTPKKSFKDSIAERASQILNDKKDTKHGPQAEGYMTRTNSPIKSTPKTTQSDSLKGKSPGKMIHSPSKVSSGTRVVQQRLLHRTENSNTTASTLAAQSRQARMAELEAVKNRWHNGVLKDDNRSDESSSECSEKPCEVAEKKTPLSKKHEQARNKARADFKDKLAEIGLGDDMKNSVPARPPPPTSVKNEKTPSQTSSIYNIIKKRDEQAFAVGQKPSPQKVKFNDSFDDSDDESMRKIPRSASRKAKKSEQEEPAFRKPPTPKKILEEASEESSVSKMTDGSARTSMEIDDDDISLKGFVSEAVRRESILPGRPVPRAASQSSLDSYEDEQTHSSSEGGGTSAGGGYRPDDESMDDDEENTDRHALDDLLDEAMDNTTDDYDPDMDPKNVVLRKKKHAVPVEGDEHYDPDMDPNNVVLRKKKTALLAPGDDNYDPDMDPNNVVLRRKPQTAYTPRSRPSYMTAVDSTDEDDDQSDRPYSLQAYRKSVNVMQHQMEPVVRNSKYHGKKVVEEDIAMPFSGARPSRDERKAVQDRIKELQELVHQEQNVIMQTSNALNKCCLGNAYFAGSSEQVECNRILLLACKKREVYMTEIQRLKETGRLSSNDCGPQGSLTINDIRLPLKKDFVTKIGTSHDNMTHFFIVLIRNGCQVICTQMLSTHDPMMRGSLDFPNLIKINGITSNFKLTLDIYSMSIQREMNIKDKKRKTPKKMKAGAFPTESPGGPTAVRTTSFSHVTSFQLTMRSLDKTSFHLDRLSHLCPLYGQIFLKIKCLMESNVEERGFLTMFDDVSGFGAWHRRWCVLSGSKLCVWKYPDDETRKDPMAVIDLKRCVTEKVGLVPRDICARPNTFEMVTVRQPLKGEHDTLVTKTHNTMTTVKHQMSADTKEERIVWCNKINRTLANLRTWNADALRPVK